MYMVWPIFSLILHKHVNCHPSAKPINRGTPVIQQDRELSGENRSFIFFFQVITQVIATANFICSDRVLCTGLFSVKSPTPPPPPFLFVGLMSSF